MIQGDLEGVNTVCYNQFPLICLAWQYTCDSERLELFNPTLPLFILMKQSGAGETPRLTRPISAPHLFNRRQSVHRTSWLSRRPVARRACHQNSGQFKVRNPHHLDSDRYPHHRCCIPVQSRSPRIRRRPVNVAWAARVLAIVRWWPLRTTRSITSCLWRRREGARRTGHLGSTRCPDSIEFM